MNVLGWYHSHPHITVHPSHVDLATQSSYQTMEQNFVGLIFSVFNYDPNTGIDSKEVAAFQSVKGEGGNNICRNIALSVRGVVVRWVGLFWTPWLACPTSSWRRKWTSIISQ